MPQMDAGFRESLDSPSIFVRGESAQNVNAETEEPRFQRQPAQILAQATPVAPGQRAPRGVNYCTAFGYDCTEEHGAHDTHTRLMPHERRMGTLGADSTVALICSFFAVDALGTLSEFTFQQPDWGAGECPGLCDPNTSSWTSSDYLYNIWNFDVSNEPGCADAERLWKENYKWYTISLTIVAVASLTCAIENATVIASGSYLLYDAPKENIVTEMLLVQRFDKWWNVTTVCRFFFSRMAFLAAGLFYILAAYYNPSLVCGSQDPDFRNNQDWVKLIGLAGALFIAGSWAFLRVAEKCITVMYGNGATGYCMSNTIQCFFRGCLCPMLQWRCFEGMNCCLLNFCRCFMECWCSCLCRYENCHCCGKGPMLCENGTLCPVDDDEIQGDDASENGGKKGCGGCCGPPKEFEEEQQEKGKCKLGSCCGKKENDDEPDEDDQL